MLNGPLLRYVRETRLNISLTIGTIVKIVSNAPHGGSKRLRRGKSGGVEAYDLSGDEGGSEHQDKEAPVDSED